MCGEVVIAVNLSTKPRSREEIASSLDVASQSLALLIGRNAGEAEAGLTGDDVLIVPVLEPFRSSSFSASEAIIGRGVDAALAAETALSRLAVSADEYDRWLEARRNRIPPPVTVGEIAAQTTGEVNAEAILRDIDVDTGTGFDIQSLHREIVDLYGRGDFSYVGYSVLPVEGEYSRVVVKADTKPWGPGYLKFGLSAATDFASPTRMNLAASYRRTWVNSLGAEWRTDLQFGHESFLNTEFFQPLQVRDGAFVAPYAFGEQHFVDYYLRDDRLGAHRIKRAQVGLDLGITGESGELRVGPYIGRVEAEPDFGLLNPVVSRVSEDPEGWRLTGIVDQLDRPQFPTSGLRARADVLDVKHKDSEPAEYTRARADITAVTGFGSNVFSVHYEWGDEISDADRLAEYDGFELGGPGRLSGLYLDQLTGSRYRLAVLRYYRQYATLPPQLGTGVYLGLSLESGRINDGLTADPWGRLDSTSVFVAADTVLGDLFLGYGYCSTLEQGEWYLVIGPSF